MKKILYLCIPLVFCSLMLAPPLTSGQRGSQTSGPGSSGKMRLLFPVAGHSNLSLVGDAGVVEGTPHALTLGSGAVWNREPLSVADGFISAFRFRIQGDALSKGTGGQIAFVIQNDGETTAAAGRCHTVVSNSLVIELNLFESRCAGGAEQGRSIDVQLNPVTPALPNLPNQANAINAATPGSSLGDAALRNIGPLDDGLTHLILVEYTPGLLNVYLDNLIRPWLSVQVDLARSLNPDEGHAWLGFAATEPTLQKIEIIDWRYGPMSDTFGIDRHAIGAEIAADETAEVSALGGPITRNVVPSGYCPGPANGPDNGTYQVMNPGSSSTIYTSTHFAARWNAGDGVPLTQAQAQAGLNTIEQIWAKYINDIGFSKPYATDASKFKVDINVSNQGWATGGGTGLRHPGMWLHFNAFQDPGALAHEFTHSLQYWSLGMRNSEFTGWFWESHAEWMRHQFFRDQVNCAEMLVNYPHLYYGSTRDRYCNWQFWEFIKDKYCYRAVNDIWNLSRKPGEAGQANEDPFSVLARNVGWSQTQLNDEFGEWAMHNATWDYPNGAVYRQRFGPYEDRAGMRRPRVTILQELDLSQRRFVVPEFWAPQRWGYNLVRLVPDNPGQSSVVTVTLRGVVQTAPASTNFGAFARQPATIPPPSSDWRWGVVARSSSGAVRYSPMQRGTSGQVSFQVNANDTELWLVVVATPSAMQKILWDQMYYTIYRYPWMVQLQGAWPEGYPNPAPPTGAGSRHPNGNGWVASTARVTATAFVGPRAQVLGNAVVSGNARIEDWAIVGGNAQVRDNAVVEDFAQVLNGQVFENARISALTIVNNGAARIHGSARIASVMNAIGAFDVSGNAQLLGDVELLTSVSRGVFYGFIDAAVAADPAYGANRTAPSPEVTVAGPFTWIGGTPTPTPTPTPIPTPTPTPTPSSPPGNCVATYQVTNQWGDGFIGGVTVANPGATPINSWTVRWTFPGNQQITNLWNGVLTTSGAAVTVKNVGSNGMIPAGGSVSFGFQAGYSGTNASPAAVTCGSP